MDRRSAVAAALLAPLAWPASAQEQPLRIVTGFAPGGATDRVARIVGDKLQARLNTTVVVENKTGAGGRLAAQLVKAARPNENVLMLANPAVMLVAPLVFKDAGYDPERDFVPVSHVNDYDFALTVGAAVPVRELSHLLAWLRANPEQANFGVPATGSLPHFFALMLAQKAGVKAQVVGYRGSAPLITDLIAGQVPVSIDTLETVLPQHEAGKVRILATSGAKRAPISPTIPTFRESGIDIAATGWNAFFAPATMPPGKVKLHADAIAAVMRDPDTQRKFAAAQMNPVVATQAQTIAMLKAYRAQWAPVVRQSGYQP